MILVRLTRGEQADTLHSSSSKDPDEGVPGKQSSTLATFILCYQKIFVSKSSVKKIRAYFCRCSGTILPSFGFSFTSCDNSHVFQQFGVSQYNALNVHSWLEHLNVQMFECRNFKVGIALRENLQDSKVWKSSLWRHSYIKISEGYRNNCIRHAESEWTFDAALLPTHFSHLCSHCCLGGGAKNDSPARKTLGTPLISTEIRINENTMAIDLAKVNKDCDCSTQVWWNTMKVI